MAEQPHSAFIEIERLFCRVGWRDAVVLKGGDSFGDIGYADEDNPSARVVTVELVGIQKGSVRCKLC